jgi:hypothetical protein
MRARWLREPGYVEYQRRRGGDPVLEPIGQVKVFGQREYIVVCGVGGRPVFVRWYAWNIDDARETFVEWMAAPLRKLTTDIYGNPVPHGHDFKPARIDWFNIAGDDDDEPQRNGAGSRVGTAIGRVIRS